MIQVHEAVKILGEFIYQNLVALENERSHPGANPDSYHKIKDLDERVKTLRRIRQEFEDIMA